MPRTLVSTTSLEKKFLNGTVYFNNTRNVQILFKKPDGTQIYYTHAPKIVLTPADSVMMPAYRTTYVKSGNLFIGVNIKMNSQWTGDLDWVIVEV